MIKSLTKISSSLFFLLSLALTTYAQESKFIITGTVTQNNHPIEGAMVTLNPKQKTTLTDENGQYKFISLSKGSYVISIKVTGANAIEKQVELDKNIQHLDFNVEVDAQHLNEVVVVSQKTINETPVSIGKSGIKGFDLPQSITVIDHELIANQQVNKLSDIIQNVNGIALGTARGSTSESFYARGYSLGKNSLLKNGSGVSSSVMPEASTLESVEVLKGSAALLYGNVSSGAVVNMVTKKPKFNYGGEISLRAGSYEMYKPIADFYGPISKDLAIRVVGTYENAGSFRNNVSSDKVYVNPSLLYKLGQKTELLLQADYLKYDNTPDFGIGTLNSKIPQTISRSASFNTPWAFNKVNQKTASLTIDHQLNNNWSLNFISGFQNYDRNYFSTERIQADENGKWDRKFSRAKSFENYFNGQLNLKGKFKTGKVAHTFLLGTDADSYVTNSNSFDGTSGTYDTINILNPDYASMRTDIPIVTATTLTKSPTYTYGVYAQDLIDLSEKIKFLAGLRFSYQKINAQTIRDLSSGDESIDASVRKQDHAFSPRLGLVFQPNKATSLFASYANSFEVNTGIDVYFNNLAPSIIDQFELGIKKDLLENRFSANFTIYKIINNNTTQQAEFRQDGITPNTDRNLKEFLGQTTSDGLEIDLSGKIVGQLNFMAGYSYTFMRFTKTPGTVNSPIEGEQFVRNVPHTANGSLFYTFNRGKINGLKLGASAFYTGNRFAGWNNKIGQSQTESRIVPVEGYTTFDLSAGYAFKKFSVLAKVANLTDVLNYTVHENYSVNPINPRQFSTTITYKF